MNVFNRITLRSLRENKVRTLVTIIGIILSAAMFTAVTTFASSLYKYSYDGAMAYGGNWQGVVFSVPQEKLDEFRADDNMILISTTQMIGYGRVEGASDSEYTDKPYLYIIAPDETFEENMPINLISGRMPENSSEILISDFFKQRNNLMELKIGDTISMELGYRSAGDDYTLSQQHRLVRDEDGKQSEEFVITGEASYTIVGFVERPGYEDYSGAGCTAFTVPSDNWDGVHDVYFNMEKPKGIYDFLDGLGGEGYNYRANTDMLMFAGVSAYNSFYTVLYSFMAIFIALIMFGSISLIYNAFAISVSERTKQFGLLSSVGATKRQLGRSVLFEALAVAVVGIPIGILCGILGIGITLQLIGDKFASIFVTSGGSALRLHVDVVSIIAALVIALITVLISAWIPARRAKKVSAIDAIRQTADVKINPRKVKTSKLTYKLFGLEGMIASKSYKRNKRRYRATVISLFMSIVLFISASSFGYYLVGGVEDVMTKNDNDIGYYYSGDSDPKDIYRLLSQVEGVGKGGYSMIASGEMKVNTGELNPRFTEAFENYGEEFLPVVMVATVTDELFREFLNEQKLSEDIYMNRDKPVLIASDYMSGYSSKTERFENFNAFSTKSAEVTLSLIDNTAYYGLSEEEREASGHDTSPFTHSYDISIGHIGQELSFGLFAAVGEVICIMVPEYLVDVVFPDYERYFSPGANTAQYFFEADSHKAVYDRMFAALDENNYPTSYLYDIAEQEETTRNILLIVNVFSYGFITLISLIAVANVFNTISTNIALRRREFAMLKSVGMTQKGFSRMSNYECMLYGAKALLYGLPVSAFTTWLIYRQVSYGWETKFTMPAVPTAIAILSVFAVVFVTMMYSMRKIKKDNPIDALKNENI